MDSDRMYEWRQFESLRILSVDCQYGACESCVHHPILKNAPHLKYLKTGCYVDIEDEDNDITDFAGYRHTLDVMSTACPEIQHLYVQHGGWDPVITVAELVSLIQAYPKGLKSLNFEMPESGQEEVISALLNSSASTLKSVVIEHYPNIPPMSKEAVARMVEECPQLEELDLNCQCHTDPSIECLHVELEAFAEAQGKPLYDMSTAPPPSTIFELPPVLDRICEHIRGRDIDNCRLVCKEWASLFDIYRWQSIYFDPPSDKHGPKSASVLRNSSRTRRLNITVSQLSSLLEQQEQPASPAGQSQGQGEIFSNLRYLTLRGGDSYQGDNNFVAANRTFRFIATMAMQLREVFLPQLMADSSLGFDYSLLSSFVTHPTLTDISLSGEMVCSDPVLTLAILKHCPPSLQRLSMCCICLGDDHAERIQMAASIVAKSERSYQWPRFGCLKDLSIGCHYGGVGSCETWVHIPILKNAPRLRKLNLFSFYSRDEIGLESFRQILETTITHCPSINHLRVDPGANPLPVADLVRLIQVYPKGLEFLMIAMPKTDQHQILNAVLQTSRSTLESLYLDFGAFTPAAIPEASIHHLIRECSKLRELEVLCTCARLIPDDDHDAPEPCIHHTFRTFIEAQGLKPSGGYTEY
ncbi:hypothetical protein BGZ90_011535 [Linnemannia elongata]|nr:hypothetical protein BGZ90_011535 [Linnemannia elongata]